MLTRLEHHKSIGPRTVKYTIITLNARDTLIQQPSKHEKCRCCKEGKEPAAVFIALEVSKYVRQ